MKKGDVVVIDDGSWSRTIKDNKLVHGPGGDKQTLSKNRKQYVIIETGCSFPNTGNKGYSYPTLMPATFNNTVIQAIDSGKVVFIEERFLKLVPPKHKILVDVIFHPGYGMGGQVIEISDKLYQEIKRDAQAE